MENKMRAAEIERFGGPEQLEVHRVEKPIVGPGQLLVKTSFASVNAMDWKLVAGHLPDWVKGFPFRPGGDFSGVVEATGPGTDFYPGAEVFGFGSGCYADYVAVDAGPVAIKPPGVSYEAAATLPIAGLTAWQAIVEDGALKAGQRVLIHGGSGGVGHFAVQIARNVGAYVIATASADNLHFLKSLGANEAIDYHDAFDSQIKDVDLVVDGSSAETQSRSYKVLKAGGLLISLIGPPPTAPAGIRIRALMLNHTRAGLAALAEAVEKQQITPHVAKVFPLVEAGAAQAFSHAKGRKGKVVLRLA
jgi:NADPH:quinone reductase-like Zn-dependent oxidoreductase